MAESIDAHERGIDLEEYFAARARDITHDEVILAHDADVDLAYYTVTRRWASHDEVIAEIARYRSSVARDAETGTHLECHQASSRRRPSKVWRRCPLSPLRHELEDEFRRVRLAQQGRPLGDDASMFLECLLSCMGSALVLALPFVALGSLAGLAMVVLCWDVVGGASLRHETRIHPLPPLEHEGFAQLDHVDPGHRPIGPPNRYEADLHLVHRTAHHVVITDPTETDVFAGLADLSGSFLSSAFLLWLGQQHLAVSPDERVVLGRLARSRLGLGAER